MNCLLCIYMHPHGHSNFIIEAKIHVVESFLVLCKSCVVQDAITIFSLQKKSIFRPETALIKH